jgi:hypothetical protein
MGSIRQSEACFAESDWIGPSSFELQTPPESEQPSCIDAKSAPARESPHLHEQNGQAVYMEPSHWMSIMQEIQDIRADLSSQDSLATDDLDITHDVEIQPDINLDVLLSRVLSVTDAISSLPPQPTCDILLANYFNSRYMVLGMHQVQRHICESELTVACRDCTLREVPNRGRSPATPTSNVRILKRIISTKTFGKGPKKLPLTGLPFCFQYLAFPAC